MGQAQWIKIRNRAYSQWVGRKKLFERERELIRISACGICAFLLGDHLLDSRNSTVRSWLARTVTDFSKVVAAENTGRWTLCSVSTS